MVQEKEYYAFISYKREDEKEAKRLQHALEHYRFPTNLNGGTDLPKSIQPIYRDVSDSTLGFLAEEIDKALCNSEWLIIVCSPRSAESPWVCKEAQTCIDQGRTDHIIPFIIEGNPFSNDIANECYPKALRNLTGSKELLAANINEMGRDAAIVKVVARMFGLKFDALWQRHEKELKKRRTWGVSLALFGILLATSIAFWMYIQRQETLRSNRVMLENRNRFIAEKALALANDGQSQTAIKLLLEALDTGPYVEEMNSALKNIISKCNTIKGHKSDVNSAFYNSKGNLIVTASNDSTIRIWDANTGINLRTFYGHHDKVRFANFCKNDSLVVSASDDRTIMIWNINS